jgi:hypothetical protein
MVACIYRSADLFGVPEEPITKAESEFGGGQQQEEHQLPRHHQQQETALNDKIDARLERVNESEEVAEDSQAATTPPEAVASKTSASQALSSVSAPLPKESAHKNRQAPGVQHSPANVQSLAVDTRTNMHVEAGNVVGEDSRPNNPERSSKLTRPAAKSHGRFWQVCSYAFVSGCVRACFVCYVFPRVQVKSSVFSMSFSPFKSMCRCIFSLRAHT